MEKDRIKVGTGVILLIFSAMYITFATFANIYAFTLSAETDSHGVGKDVLQLASVLMDIAAASFAAFSVCWNIRAHKGWGNKTSLRFFRWICANAVLMFFLPPALSYDAANMFSSFFAFMGFTPVLSPVVMMVAAAVVMLDIIKQKNGGTLRKRR